MDSPAPLLERARELALIGDRLQRAYHDEGGALVVEGQAGSGKTALLAAARAAAAQQGFRVLRARGAELERGFAYGVVRQLVEPLLAEASPEERAALLHGAAGMAAQVLGLAAPGDDGAAAPAAPDPGFAALHGLYWLCANLASERPVTLVVDDAHWADTTSLRFLAFLLPRLEELPVAVLLGARPAQRGAVGEVLTAVTLDPASDAVRLRPLTTAAVAELVQAGLGATPDPAFAAACENATGGIPFLVHTLVAALRDEDVAPVAAQAPRVQEIATSTAGS